MKWTAFVLVDCVVDRVANFPADVREADLHVALHFEHRFFDVVERRSLIDQCETGDGGCPFPFLYLLMSRSTPLNIPRTRPIAIADRTTVKSSFDIVQSVSACSAFNTTLTKLKERTLLLRLAASSAHSFDPSLVTLQAPF
jgi:hypothetical protein